MENIGREKIDETLLLTKKDREIEVKEDSTCWTDSTQNFGPYFNVGSNGTVHVLQEKEKVQYGGLSSSIYIYLLRKRNCKFSSLYSGGKIQFSLTYHFLFF